MSGSSAHQFQENKKDSGNLVANNDNFKGKALKDSKHIGLKQMSNDDKLIDFEKIFNNQSSNALSDEMLNGAVNAYGEGEFAKAEEILSSLIAIFPKEIRALKLLASTLWLQDKFNEAEEAYENAYAADPEDLYVLAGLAEIKLKSLKLNQAIGLLERLFEMDPNATHPAANRGRQLAQEYHKKLGG